MISVINLLLFIVFICTIILAFKKTAYGYGCFIVARILIPEIARSPLSESISFNTNIILVVILAFIYHNRNNIVKVIKKESYVITLLLFSLYTIITLPFSDYGDLSIQLKYTVQFFLTDIIPIVLFAIIVYKAQDLNVIIKSFLLATIICCTYSVFTAIIHFNPIVAVFQLAFDKTGDLTMDDMASDLSTGRGYAACGTFIHANGFGYFISMSIPICMYLITRGYDAKLSKIALLLLIINLFLCKKRSPLVSMGTFLLLYLYLSKSKDKIRYIFYFIIGCLFTIVLIETIPALYSIRNMLETSLFFWDDKALEKSDVGGSSWDLRTRQVFYPFVEIANNIVFGHGFGWCRWFLDEYELHPLLFGFETIFSTSICELGIFGYLAYYMLFRKSYLYSRPMKVKETNVQLLALYAEIVLIIATGLNYFYFWGFSVIVMRKGDLLHLKK